MGAGNVLCVCACVCASVSACVQPAHSGTGQEGRQRQKASLCLELKAALCLLICAPSCVCVCESVHKRV